ncbi:hypothetical protein EON65_19835 [archaeon]|nr:MAG: hypothetical protein EON65_19835 [archaeon]
MFVLINAAITFLYVLETIHFHLQCGSIQFIVLQAQLSCSTGSFVVIPVINSLCIPSSCTINMTCHEFLCVHSSTSACAKCELEGDMVMCEMTMPCHQGTGSRDMNDTIISSTLDRAFAL